MPRYRLLVEYDGRPYKGYQAQADQPTVQDSIERAVKAFCGEAVRLQAAGRTDTGVHATGAVLHVDLEKDWKPAVVRDALNAHLVPEPISILEVDIPGGDWHARFSAKERRYLYRILNRKSPPALDQGRVWHVKKPLDVGAMHEAAQALVGHHDFTSFRAALCQAASPVKTLDRLDVMRHGPEVAIIAEARSFLHHQVRNMVGTLKLVGEGKWSIGDVARALAARDRAAAGPTAPPDGLYLTGVRY
jgi:tRNA pseudouridine38-40 synthase